MNPDESTEHTRARWKATVDASEAIVRDIVMAATVMAATSTKEDSTMSQLDEYRKTLTPEQLDAALDEVKAYAEKAKQEGTMSDIQVTQEILDQAMALVQQEKAAAQVSQMAEPKLLLAVRMAVGLANAVTGTENLARHAKGSVKGFAATFKAAYVANRPVVTPTMPKDVSPEELAEALKKIQAGQ